VTTPTSSIDIRHLRSRRDADSVGDAWPASLRRRWLIAFALLLFGVVFFLPALLAPRHFPGDDAYFYAQVARNIVAGKGSTFSGVTSTNGYHPLWMAFCVAAAAIAPGRMPALRLIMGIDMALTLVILWLYVRMCRDLRLRFWILGLPILIAYFTTGLYLSEAHINAVTVLASLLLLVRAMTSRAPPKQWVVVGVVLGLSILARLDNIFFVFAAIVAILTVEGAPFVRVRRVALTIAGVAVVTAPYLADNYARYGRLNTISGAIKSTFPKVEGSIRSLGTLGLACALVAIVSVLYALTSRIARDRRCVLIVLGVGVLGHAAYVVLFTDTSQVGVASWSWYYVLGVLNATIFMPNLVEDVVERLPKSAERWARAAIAVAVVALLALGGIRAWARYENAYGAGPNQFALHFGRTQDRWSVELANWMRLHMSHRARIAAYDDPGQFAYFSGLSILPLDGLINDYQYERDMLRLGPANYLAEHGVTFYVGPINAHPGRVQVQPIDAPLYHRVAGRLMLDDARIVVRVRDVDRTAPDWAVWQLS
jgi:Dolichyl-phosphate-mannose-protein mannosyltransferase